MHIDTSASKHSIDTILPDSLSKRDLTKANNAAAWGLCPFHLNVVEEGSHQ